MTDCPGCTIKTLGGDQAVEAAKVAVAHNPANRPSPSLVLSVLQTVAAHLGIEPERVTRPDPEHIAVVTSKYWGAKGKRFTVGFFESAPSDLQARVLEHMNAWGQYCNVQFVIGADPIVRITRSGDGYWSYLGTDILSIPRSEPTMCLQDFTMNTPEGEYRRVVRHETGHTLGCPHEHLRPELIARIDRQKAVDYFQRTQGWSPQVTVQQVLTPDDERSLMGTPHADQDSIMCYQLPGSITVDGQPIRGGTDIEKQDAAFMATLYPLPDKPAPPPAGGTWTAVLTGSGPAPSGLAVALTK